MLQVGLLAFLAAGAWAADWTASGSRAEAPRELQPVPGDAHVTANERDPAPPTPTKLKPINADPRKAPKADDSPKSPALPMPPPTGGASGCGESAPSCTPGGSGANPCGAAAPACAANCCPSGCCVPATGCVPAGCTRERWFDVGDCTDGCPWWSVTAGVMVLHRSGSRNYVIGDGPLTAGEFSEGWGTGPRFEIARHYQKWDVEFVYWGVENWNDELLAATPSQGQEMASYDSRLYNGEWNLKRKFAQLTFLAGLRYMELQEKLYDEEITSVGTSIDQRRAANYLYGFQLGAEAELARCERFSLGAFAKVGVFSNHIHESGTVLGDATRSETSLLGETGLSAKLKLTKHLSAYGAYEVMWIDGVLLAPDMLGAAALGQAELNTPFYHGANAGLEICW